MTQHDTGTNPSKVAVMQHPLHPMVVVFPISFLASTLPADLLFLWLGDPFWARVAFYLSAAGLAAGGLAAMLGMGDFFLMREARKHVTGWNHFMAGIMLLSLAGTNVQLRWDDPVAGVMPWGVFVSALVFGMVMVTGWLGGTLTFMHGIGTYSGTGDRPARNQARDFDGVDLEEDAPPGTDASRRGGDGSR